MSSGLVKVAGELGAAANDERVDAENSEENNRRNDVADGWDPYEIWRTRVKAERDSRVAALPEFKPPRKR